jgi:hypothetical protein
MFNALLSAIAVPMDYTASTLRRQVASFMAKNSDMCSSFISPQLNPGESYYDYVLNTYNSTIWGDSCILQVIGLMWGVAITVITPHITENILHSRPDADVYLIFNGRDHYTGAQTPGGHLIPGGPIVQRYLENPEVINIDTEESADVISSDDPASPSTSEVTAAKIVSVYSNIISLEKSLEAKAAEINLYLTDVKKRKADVEKEMREMGILPSISPPTSIPTQSHTPSSSSQQPPSPPSDPSQQPSPSSKRKSPPEEDDPSSSARAKRRRKRSLMSEEEGPSSSRVTSLTCKFCKTVFTKTSDIKYHYNWSCKELPESLEEQRLKNLDGCVCPKSPLRKFTGPKGVDQHIKRAHPEFKYECVVCKAKFALFSQFHSHKMETGHKGG